MTNDNFILLCDDLEQIASEVLNDQEPDCTFSEDESLFDNENYSAIFEGRD